MVDRNALQASRFRDTWNRLWSGYFGSFDDTTRIKPMRFTDESALPFVASTCSTLQIFSVKVAGIEEGLQWPLQVFGMVATQLITIAILSSNAQGITARSSPKRIHI